MPNDPLTDNLQEINDILEECGAEATWIIQAATRTTLTFILGGHQLLLPIRDGGTLLVSYFPPTPNLTLHQDSSIIPSQEDT